jgi:hypothetical protein
MTPKRELRKLGRVEAPEITLKQARSLAAQIIDLEYKTEDFYDCCTAAEARARMFGAHSMARLCRWLATPEVFDKNGYDAIHWYAEERANKWLNAIEAKAFREWGP